MVYLPLFDYFRCADDAAASLEGGLSSIAARSREQASPCLLARSGVTAVPGPGRPHIPDLPGPGRPTGTAGPARRRGRPPGGDAGDCLRRGRGVFNPACRCCCTPGCRRRSSTTRRSSPEGWWTPPGWRPRCGCGGCCCFRFESDAAGEDWSQGGLGRGPAVGAAGQSTPCDRRGSPPWTHQLVSAPLDAGLARRGSEGLPAGSSQPQAVALQGPCRGTFGAPSAYYLQRSGRVRRQEVQDGA